MPEFGYTNKETGAPALGTYSTSSSDQRPDEDGAGLQAAINRSAGSATRSRSVAEAANAAMDGRRTLPADGTVRTRVATAFTADATSLIVESTVGFVAGVPIAVIDEIGGSILAYATPSVVANSTTFTLPSSGGAELGSSYEIGALVIQFPTVNRRMLSSRPIQGDAGVKAQLERANRPTLTGVDGGAQDIDVSVIPNGGGVYSAEAYVDVYIFANASVGNIEEHVLPSDFDTAVPGTPVAIAGITTYWDETTNTLETITAGTYYITCIIKDISGFALAQESQAAVLVPVIVA